MHNRLQDRRAPVLTCSARGDKVLFSAWSRGIWRTGAAAFILAATAFLGACDSTDDVLAPYEGERPLVLQRVTQSFTPDVQWVGGRVAAVGVNRGPRAALDSTLVWIVRADEDVIGSHVTVGQEGDADFVASLGGEALEALEDGEEYTFWLAERSALAAGLDSSNVNSFSFADTTLAMELVLLGRSGGDRSLDLQVQVTRDESLLEERYILDWSPVDVPFRQIAIRAGSTGGFSDLIWHVVQSDEDEDNIYPPVVIGEPPEGTVEAIPFSGFESNVYTIWMTNSDWDGNFLLRSEGYVFFQVFASNFEEAE